MNLKAILEKLQKGETLSAEELAFLVERSVEDPERGLAEQVERAVAAALEPLMAAQRTIPVGAAAAEATTQPAYAPRINAFTDLVAHIARNEPASLIKERALSVGSDADGGYLVPTVTMAEIVKYLNEYGAGRRFANVIPSQASQMLMNTLDSGLTAYYTNELAAITATTQTYSQVSLAAKKLAVLAGPMSNEILRDALVDLQAETSVDAGEAFAYGEDNQIFNGDGTTFTGLLHNTAVNEKTLVGGISGLDYDTVNSMVYAVPSQRLLGARWWAHRTVIELLMAITDGEGRPLFRESLIAGQPSTMLGFPVEAVEAMPAAADVASGDSFLAFGNLKGVHMYDIGAMAISLLREGAVVVGATTYNLGQMDASALRFVERHIITVRRPKAFVRLKLG